MALAIYYGLIGHQRLPMQIYSYTEEVTTKTLYAFAVSDEIENLGEAAVTKYLEELGNRVGGWQFMQHSEALIEGSPWKKREKLGCHSDEEWAQWETAKADQLEYGRNFIKRYQAETNFLRNCAEYFSLFPHSQAVLEPHSQAEHELLKNVLVDFFSKMPLLESDDISGSKYRFFIAQKGAFKIFEAEDCYRTSVQYDSLTAFYSCDISDHDVTEALRILGGSVKLDDFADLEDKLERLALNRVEEKITQLSGMSGIGVEAVVPRGIGGISIYSIKLPRALCSTLAESCMRNANDEYVSGTLSWFADSPRRVVGFSCLDSSSSCASFSEDEIPF